MDNYFQQIQNPTQASSNLQTHSQQPQPFAYGQTFNVDPSDPTPPQPPPQYNYAQYTTNQPTATFADQTSADNEFNDFEQDETTRRIREDEQRIQARLRQKSNKQYQDKLQRQQEGRKQLRQFLDRKQEEKDARAAQNIRQESDNKEEMAKLNQGAGWRKVIANINVRHGEHKGKKDTNRMREAILHRREDDGR